MDRYQAKATGSRKDAPPGRPLGPIVIMTTLAAAIAIGFAIFLGTKTAHAPGSADQIARQPAQISFSDIDRVNAPIELDRLMVESGPLEHATQEQMAFAERMQHQARVARRAALEAAGVNY